MADCMQFLSENRLNGCQIFGRFGFWKPNPNTNRSSVFRKFLLVMSLLLVKIKAHLTLQDKQWLHDSDTLPARWGPSKKFPATAAPTGKWWDWLCWMESCRWTVRERLAVLRLWLWLCWTWDNSYRACSVCHINIIRCLTEQGVVPKKPVSEKITKIQRLDVPLRGHAAFVQLGLLTKSQ